MTCVYLVPGPVVESKGPSDILKNMSELADQNEIGNADIPVGNDPLVGRQRSESAVSGGLRLRCWPSAEALFWPSDPFAGTSPLGAEGEGFEPSMDRNGP